MAPCRQQHLLATTQLQSMARLMEDAAAGRYKRAVDTSGTAAAASAGPSQPATEAASAAPTANDTKQRVQAELSKAAAKQGKLVDLIQDLQRQVPSLHDELSRVLLHAAAAQTWLPSQAAAVH